MMMRGISLPVGWIPWEIGRLSVEILAAMDGYFEEHDAVEFQVPMGAALGENIFIGWWPDIPFRVRLIGNADINYDSTVEAAGINQVHHKVWLDLKFTIQVAAPLMKRDPDIQPSVCIGRSDVCGGCPARFHGRGLHSRQEFGMMGLERSGRHGSISDGSSPRGGGNRGKESHVLSRRYCR